MNGNVPAKNGKIDLGNIEFEYVNMDENILAPGRVRKCFLIILQHVAEFKHIFEHFTTPMNQNDIKIKRKEDEKRNNEEKDAFTKTTELHEGEEKKEK